MSVRDGSAGGVALGYGRRASVTSTRPVETRLLRDDGVANPTEVDGECQLSMNLRMDICI